MDRGFRAYKVKAEFYVYERNGTMINELLFECDPELNQECGKQSCGVCKVTKNIHYAKKYYLDEMEKND